jgi:two-component system response regulator DegU
VLHLFAHGALPSQVAQQLYVSPKTVKNHLSHIYAKLGVANRTQAVAVAIRQGIVTIA